MDAREQRIWKYILNNRGADPLQVARACAVTLEEVTSCLGRIGSPEEIWREDDAAVNRALDGPYRAMPEDYGLEEWPKDSALGHQVGGDHYASMDVQPWEAMEAWLTPEEYRGYHKGVAIGYLAREQQKGGDQDIRKAIHHLQRLVETWGEK